MQRRRGSLPGFDAGVGMPPAAIIRAAAHGRGRPAPTATRPALATHGHRKLTYKPRWWNSDLGFRVAPSPAGQDKLSQNINRHCHELRKSITSARKQRRQVEAELARLRAQVAARPQRDKEMRAPQTSSIARSGCASK